MAIAQRRMTLEKFLCLPEKEPALEFEEGVVSQKVSPKMQHSALQDQAVQLFNRFARRRKLARAFPELRFTYGGRSYVPDVAVYLWHRILVDERGRLANDYFEPPDVAVEIVSPEQSVNALVSRCLWYVANGVWVALLVDPGDDSVLVFRRNAPPEAVHAPAKIDLSDVLSGFTLSVKELFSALTLR